MKTYLFFVFILLPVMSVCGQNTGFSYDADGNLESRYIIQLSSPANAPQETTATDAVTVEKTDRKITIYPNPTKGRIMIDITPVNSGESNFLYLYGMKGELLESMKITSGQTELEITGAPGVYLLNIHLGGDVSKWKIIKQ